MTTLSFDEASGLPDTGLDSGEGLVSRLLVSDDPRAGTWTTFASCLPTGVAGCAVEAVLISTLRFPYDESVNDHSERH